MEYSSEDLRSKWIVRVQYGVHHDSSAYDHEQGESHEVCEITENHESYFVEERSQLR